MQRLQPESLSTSIKRIFFQGLPLGLFLTATSYLLDNFVEFANFTNVAYTDSSQQVPYPEVTWKISTAEAVGFATTIFFPVVTSILARSNTKCKWLIDTITLQTSASVIESTHPRTCNTLFSPKPSFIFACTAGSINFINLMVHKYTFTLPDCFNTPDVTRMIWSNYAIAILIGALVNIPTGMPISALLLNYHINQITQEESIQNQPSNNGDIERRSLSSPDDSENENHNNAINFWSDLDNTNADHDQPAIHSSQSANSSRSNSPVPENNPAQITTSESKSEKDPVATLTNEDRWQHILTYKEGLSAELKNINGNSSHPDAAIKLSIELIEFMLAEITLPDESICPITREVITESGQGNSFHYEKSAINEWLEMNAEDPFRAPLHIGNVKSDKQFDNIIDHTLKRYEKLIMFTSNQYKTLLELANKNSSEVTQNSSPKSPNHY